MAVPRSVLVLALGATRLVAGQSGFGVQAVLDRLPPSYAQLCTIAHPDGTFSANPSACPSSLACTADPQRSGAFYCGIGGSPCTSGANCVGGDNYACVGGTCLGGYGQKAFYDGPVGGGNYYLGCLGNLHPGGYYSSCGDSFAVCGLSNNQPRDLNCISGVCGPGDYGYPTCVDAYTSVGTPCEPSKGYRCAQTDSGQQLYCRSTDNTCQLTLPLGATCDATSACSPPYYCSASASQVDNEHKCVTLATTTTIGGSCSADPSQCTITSTGRALFCQESVNGRLCAAVGTSEYSNCYGDVSGNACASPRYCTGPNAPVGLRYQCRTKASLGGSCAFDPVNGCSTGLYCTSTDQTCQAISTAAAQTCGTDSNACSASSGLYCVEATQLCAKKATTVGATCAFDLLNGCSTSSSGQQLYCRSSDATCQVRQNSIGADCRADPGSACGTATAADGTTTPLYCSAPSYLCAAKVGARASCASNPAQACLDPYYCSSNNNICISRVTTPGDYCNADPYMQCGVNPSYASPGSNGQLYPSIETLQNGNQACFCFTQPGSTSATPPSGAFGVTAIGDDCSSDPTFACGYSSTGVKLYCALSTNTCQAHVTTVGGSCAYDYLGACGITTDGTSTQLYPSIPVGSSGHAGCTCVTQTDVVVRPSSRARARARSRRNLSLCPGSHTACPIGNGFECIDTENNLEQCSEQGGVDCTALPGVAAVGCVGGRCEIWACERGFAFDAATEGCARSYE